jgi:putative ABC transport system permease protein
MNTIQDLRYAWRQLRKAPGFAAVAIVTLALGIGANTAIFSVIEAVLLRPLPFPRPERLVAVNEVDFRRGLNGGASSASWPNYFDWRSKVQSMSALSAYHHRSFTVTGPGPAQHLPGEVVSSDFFSTLGVQPAMGRTFGADEEQPGRNVIVVSDQFWRSELGMSRDAVGSALTVNGRPFTIIGVMPPGLRFPIEFPAPELWTTVAEDMRSESPGDTPITAERGAHLLQVIGRLKDGTTIREAQAELDVIARGLASQYPADDTDRGARLVPELEALVGQVRAPLLVLLAAVGCVLLIACGNVANLLTARGAARHREIALRAALGASRWRVVRLLLAESMMLSALGTGLGLALASGPRPERRAVDTRPSAAPTAQRAGHSRDDDWCHAARHGNAPHPGLRALVPHSTRV